MGVVVADGRPRDPGELALLFKRLATLKTEEPLFDDVESLRWRGPTPRFRLVADEIGDARWRLAW